jgi:hypothetical protein
VRHSALPLPKAAVPEALIIEWGFFDLRDSASLVFWESFMDNEKGLVDKLTDFVKSVTDPESGTSIDMPHNESGAEIKRAAVTKKRGPAPMRANKRLASARAAAKASKERAKQSAPKPKASKKKTTKKAFAKKSAAEKAGKRKATKKKARR